MFPFAKDAILVGIEIPLNFLKFEKTVSWRMTLDCIFIDTAIISRAKVFLLMK
jgi:hypothetical protein